MISTYTNNKLSWIYWILISGISIIGVYFILLNAQWCIGDDVILMEKTGSGIPFQPKDRIVPDSGRFFPFSYLIYNIVLLFHFGYTSAFSHYIINALMFCIFAFSFAYLLKSIFKEHNIKGQAIAMLGAFVAICRVYPYYLNVYSTIWQSCTLISIFLLFAYIFYTKKHMFAGVLAILVITYYCFCLESGFVIPISFGFAGLLLFGKDNSKKDKIFYFALILSGLIFIAHYLFMVFPYIENAYDGAHGSKDSILVNAGKMLIGQKILMVAFIISIFRIIEYTKRRPKFTYFDILLFTAWIYCFECFILRLNWTMYYSIGVLVALPAVVFYSLHYFKYVSTTILLLLLAFLYSYKIPNHIKTVQTARTSCVMEISKLSSLLKSDNKIYWYSPEYNEYNYNIDHRWWEKYVIQEYLRWTFQNKTFIIPERKSYTGEIGIWLNSSDNKALFPFDTTLESNGEECFNGGGIIGYLMKR